jgi:hypothetical protein
LFTPLNNEAKDVQLAPAGIYELLNRIYVEKIAAIMPAFPDSRKYPTFSKSTQNEKATFSA